MESDDESETSSVMVSDREDVIVSVSVSFVSVGSDKESEKVRLSVRLAEGVGGTLNV